MTSINNPDNFAGRIDFAAAYIAAGRNTSRSFDSCFENDDGDAVVTALYRRAQAKPTGRLAANLWRYLARESVERTATENAHRTDLAAWAAELRAQGRAQFQAMMDRMNAGRAA